MKRVFIGFNNTGSHFQGILLPQKSIVPSRIIFSLLLASNSDEASTAFNNLILYGHKQYITANDPQELGEALANKNTVNFKAPQYCEAYIWDPCHNCFNGHHWDNRTPPHWDIDTLDISNGTKHLFESSQLINSKTLCGISRNVFEKMIFPPQEKPETAAMEEKRSWYFITLAVTRSMNFSVCSKNCDPEALLTFAQFNTSHQNAWPENAEEAAHQLLKKGELEIDEDHGTDPSKIILEALQQECDQRVKDVLQKYDPLTESENLDIFLDPYTVLNTFYQCNRGYLICNDYNEHHPEKDPKVYVLKKQIITDLADQAILKYKEQDITAAVNLCNNVKKQGAHL